MNKISKIYIAGHTGLVGSALVRRLKEESYNNLICKDYTELDLRNQKQAEDFFDQEKPDYVFLAAAKVGGILANSTYKAEFIYDNIMIATNVINASYKYKVKKLLNLGSSCIYPKNAPQPLKEEYLLSAPLEPTNEPYAIAKIAAIKLCRYYNEQYGTNFISVMPTNLYGPNDNFNLETSHVLPALIRKFHLALLLSQNKHKEILKDLNIFGNKCKGKDDVEITKHLSQYGIYPDKVILWGTGEPFREFLHVDDLANACLFLMQKHDAKDIGEFINIGTGKDLKVKELAKMVKGVTGFKGKIEQDVSKPVGTRKKLLDTSRMAMLGWKAKVGIEQGIKDTYGYYNNNQTV